MLLGLDFQLIVDVVAASKHPGLASNHGLFLFRLNRPPQRDHSVHTDNLDVMRDR